MDCVSMRMPENLQRLRLLYYYNNGDNNNRFTGESAWVQQQQRHHTKNQSFPELSNTNGHSNGSTISGVLVDDPSSCFVSKDGRHNSAKVKGDNCAGSGCGGGGGGGGTQGTPPSTRMHDNKSNVSR